MAEQDTDSAGMSCDSTQPNDDDMTTSDGCASMGAEEKPTPPKQGGAKRINANGAGKAHRKASGRPKWDQLYDEIQMLSKEKQKQVMKEKEPAKWKSEIQQRIEREIDQQVREALETPPLERMERNRHKAKLRKLKEQEYDAKQDRSLSLDECNSYAKTLPSLRSQQPWNKTVNGKFRYYDQSSEQSDPGVECPEGDSNSRGGDRTQATSSPGAWGDGGNTTEIGRNPTSLQQRQDAAGVARDDGEESDEKQKLADIRRKTFHRYTSKGFKEALKQGKLKLKKLGNGRYMDKNGVVLTDDGPFWPPEYGPLCGKPEHVYDGMPDQEPLSDAVAHDGRTVQNQRTKWYRPWERPQVVFDSERTSKGTVPHTSPEGCCPSVVFESRFESGNLRQAKRIGQFEYDLVLKTDLYTNRHTQWYYFRIQRMVPGVTYKFNIINLLKKDSLYNHGMRPLLYSEKEAETSKVGWRRSGHHIGYTRSYGYNRNSLLHPEMTHYVLEFQMEFRFENDTCYLAHCYPYTFTDLKDHLDSLLAQSERRRFLRREVMCETKAGNSCFLLTISNFSEKSNQGIDKKAIVVTARVHPGETNSSWMMKGLLEFITGPDPVAKQLRDLFIFKIIPMLNPDGVIVGNYRCSLSARDLNRNYRHPKKESFPTIWHLKNMLEELMEEREVVVYCDLHGHSCKHNVFIYGCDPQSKEGDAATFLYQRLFPWLMSQMAPDKFSFRGCKFRVKRCKEATGRVVMWRQMNILNSFTMEATFCGAKNMESVDSPRHFNASDFQDLGKHFCEALLAYHKAQQNKSLHSELILELTREITHQVLQSRGLLPEPLKGLADYNGDGSKTQGQQADPNAKGDHSSRSSNTKSNRKDGKDHHHHHHKSPSDGVRKIQSRLEALKMIDAMSSETIKGCIHILQDLKIIKEFVESDTSDSDSASESELPEAPEEEEEIKPQSKKKKKKSKHKSRGVTSSSGKFSHLKKYPPFVNRYIKRSNGGIPMFSQERRQERDALKRLDTIHKIQQEGQEGSSIQYTAAEYDRLLAITKQIHQQEAEVQLKMSSSAPTSHSANQNSLKYPYTHSNSFHGLQQLSAPSPHRLQPMDPMNTWNPPPDDNHATAHQLKRSHTMIQLLHHNNQSGSSRDASDYINISGGLETEHGYRGSELTNHSVDGNNNFFESPGIDRMMHHRDDSSSTMPYSFGKRALTHLHMKPPKPAKMDDTGKPVLGRPSLSAALPPNSNASFISSPFKTSSSRHKTAPVRHDISSATGGNTDFSDASSVPRGHAADLITQQYDHFLSQTSHKPQSAAARYLENLTKSISKGDAVRPILALSKTSESRESTFQAKKLSDIKAKTGP